MYLTSTSVHIHNHNEVYSPVFSSTRIRFAVWMDGEVVDGAEVSLDSPELLLVEHVVEPRLELAL